MCTEHAGSHAGFVLESSERTRRFLLELPFPASLREKYQELARQSLDELMWLEAAEPAAVKGLAKIDKGAGARCVLRESLETSAAALAHTIELADRSGKMRAYKRGVTAFWAMR